MATLTIELNEDEVVDAAVGLVVASIQSTDEDLAARRRATATRLLARWAIAEATEQAHAVEPKPVPVEPDLGFTVGDWVTCRATAFERRVVAIEDSPTTGFVALRFDRRRTPGGDEHPTSTSMSHRLDPKSGWHFTKVAA